MLVSCGIVQQIPNSFPLAIRGSDQERTRPLDHKHSSHDGNDNRPVSETMQHPDSARIIIVVLATCGGRAVGEGAVDQNGPGAVDVGDGDVPLPQVVGRAGADGAVDEGLVVVLLAGAQFEPRTAAKHRRRLVSVAGAVVVAPVVVVRVHVSTVEPHAGPEGQGAGSAEEEEGSDARGRE